MSHDRDIPKIVTTREIDSARHSPRRVASVREAVAVTPSAVVLAPRVRRRVFLRRSAGPAHRHAVCLDDVARVGTAVALVLEAAARIAFTLERAWIALLPGSPPVELPSTPASEHGTGVPGLVVVNLRDDPVRFPSFALD